MIAGLDSIFYVYVYLDPRKPGNYKYGKYVFNYEPFYIGKGKNDRMFVHQEDSKKSYNHKSHFFNKMRKIRRKGYEPIVTKVAYKLTEKDAFNLEIELIREIGRYHYGGLLCNISSGGEGGTFPSEFHWLYGKKHSKETIKKISETLKINNPMFNEKHRETLRKSLSNPEVKRKMIHKGSSNGMYGKGYLLSGEKHPYHGKTRAKNVCEALQKSSSRTWIVNTPDGHKIKVFNLCKFCRDNNLNYGALKARRTVNGHSAERA